MDYPCGKIDCSFSHFGFIVLTKTHTHTDADECLTPTSVVSLSIYSIYSRITCKVFLYYEQYSQKICQISSGETSPCHVVAIHALLTAD